MDELNDESDENKQQIINAILEFQNEFAIKFGFIPIITLRKSISVNRRTLDELEYIGNSVLNEPIKYPQGIRTRTRKREVLIIRQAISKIAADMGYTFQAIGYFFGYSHCTILHSKKTINNLISTKNPDLIKTIFLINEEIKRQFSNDGVVQSDNQEGINT
jgi:hypothetical protein